MSEADAVAIVPAGPQATFAADAEAGPRLTIIRADNRLSDSWMASLSHLFRELLRYRLNIATIYQQDLRSSYKGSASEVFWKFALPVLPIAVYAALAGFRVVPAHDGISPVANIAVGTTLWFLMTGCVQQPIAIVRTRNADAMKTAMPLSVAIGSGFTRLMFESLVRLGLIGIILVLTRTMPALTFPLSFVVVAIALASFLGLGLMLSILNIIYPDVERITTVFTTYGIFLSGVVFPLSAFGPFAALDIVNPFAVFIKAARELMLAGTLSHPWALAAMSVFGGIIFVAGCRQFYLMEFRIRGVG